MTSNGMMVIGASRDSIDAAKTAINDILKAPVGDTVKKTALKTLAGICEVKNVTISNCTFNEGVKRT